MKGFARERVRKAQEQGVRKATVRQGEVRETAFPVRPADSEVLNLRDNAHFFDQTNLPIWWSATWGVSTWGG